MPLYQAFTLNTQVPLNSELPQAASLVSRWDLTEDGDKRYDRKGANHLTDNATVASADGFTNTSTGVKFQRVADFERTNSEFLSITDAAQSGLDLTSSFSFSFWAKFESLPGTMGIFGKQDNDVVHGNTYMLILDGASKLYFETDDGVTTKTVGASAAIASTGVWYHIAGVYQASTRLELYQDGASIATNSTSILASLNNNAYPFRIGAQKTGGAAANFFDGLIQDFCIWSTALTDAEVTTLYNLYAPSTGISASNSSGLLLMGVG